MNHLAHLLTAGNDDDKRLGVLLGDHVRGRSRLKDFPFGIRTGIELHRAVDSFTDQDQNLANLRNHFKPPYRRYVGIMLDVYFDHLLSLSWSRYCEQPLNVYAAGILHLLETHREQLPPGLERFRHYAVTTGVLGRYGEINVLDKVYQGIGQRMKHANPLAESLKVLQPEHSRILDAFEGFFPRLMAFSKQWQTDYETANSETP